MSKTRRTGTHGRAYVTNLGSIAVYGEPGTCHNCDEMGCPSASHIVAWGRVERWDHDDHEPDADGDCARCGASAESDTPCTSLEKVGSHEKSTPPCPEATGETSAMHSARDLLCRAEGVDPTFSSEARGSRKRCPLNCDNGLDWTTDGAEIYVVFCEACYPLMYKYWAERQLTTGDDHARDE